jgi:glycerol-3-phosphate acyltransferase PlsY
VKFFVYSYFLDAKNCLSCQIQMKIVVSLKMGIVGVDSERRIKWGHLVSLMSIVSHVFSIFHEFAGNNFTGETFNVYRWTND